MTDDATVTVTGFHRSQGISLRRGLVEDGVVCLLGRLGMSTPLPTSKPLSTAEGFLCGGIAGCIAVRR